MCWLFNSYRSRLLRLNPAICLGFDLNVLTYHSHSLSTYRWIWEEIVSSLLDIVLNNYTSIHHFLEHSTGRFLNIGQSASYQYLLNGLKRSKGLDCPIVWNIWLVLEALSGSSFTLFYLFYWILLSTIMHFDVEFINLGFYKEHGAGSWR